MDFLELLLAMTIVGVVAVIIAYVCGKILKVLVDWEIQIENSGTVFGLYAYRAAIFMSIVFILTVLIYAFK